MAPRPKYQPKTRKAPALPAPADTPTPDLPTTMPGFDQFAASDYTMQGSNGRMLTVSPLRAIMDEQRGLDEHIVTERTRQGVLYGAGLGMEHKVLARIMGIDEALLRELYSAELETGTHLLMSDIKTNMYNIARDPTHTQAVRAGMYLLGKLGGDMYRESKRLEATQVNPETRTIDPSTLTEDQRDLLKEILTSAMRLAQPGAPMLEGEFNEVEDDDAEDLL